MNFENIIWYSRFFFSCRRVKTDISAIMLYCQGLFWEEGRHWIPLGQGSTPNCTGKKEKILENCTVVFSTPTSAETEHFQESSPSRGRALSRGTPTLIPTHPCLPTPHHVWKLLMFLFPCLLPVSPQIKISTEVQLPLQAKHGPQVWYLGLVVGDL